MQYAAVLAAGDQPNVWLVLGLMALAGALAGGAWSLRKRSIVFAVILGLAALLALAAGIMQQVPA
ncbi:hypothetical protein EK0264_01635 [Epidermidibacterium keratini]|uniref:Uncharacterized protein n=1 Tax=Epidermidibacterium keratini TaxID=1891644 RepID=A0A7L4YJ44_9ACTN|nr:hypothetical protein [Epidermidibacterium keratini]QHB99117.1 hypothetical protein EK0264_01635 [Epidermidibacterium keratini]